MNRFLSRGLFTACAPALGLLFLLAPPVAAQSLKPGLWEINNKMQSSSGQVEKAMAEAQKQMAAMPPEQRKLMQDMMAKQGVAMAPVPEATTWP